VQCNLTWWVCGFVMVCRTQNFHNFVKVALTKQPKRRPTSDKLLEVSGNTRSVTERQNRNSLLLQHIQSLQWPSVLRRCWLVGWQEEYPTWKNWVVGCWHGYLFGARCRLAYGPADATATLFLASVKSRWFYFSGTSSPRLSWTKRRKMGVCVCYMHIQLFVITSQKLEEASGNSEWWWMMVYFTWQLCRVPPPQRVSYWLIWLSLLFPVSSTFLLAEGCIVDYLMLAISAYWCLASDI